MKSWWKAFLYGICTLVVQGIVAAVLLILVALSTSWNVGDTLFVLSMWASSILTVVLFAWIYLKDLEKDWMKESLMLGGVFNAVGLCFILIIDPVISGPSFLASRKDWMLFVLDLVLTQAVTILIGYWLAKKKRAAPSTY